MSEIQVLMIEDNPGDLRLIREILDYTGMGYEQRVARNAEEAIAVLSSSSWRPDIVFVDLNLPGKSGWEVLKLMKSRSELKAIPTVVITGILNKEEIKKAKDLGVDLSLEKYRDTTGLDNSVDLVRDLLCKRFSAFVKTSDQ